MKPFAQSFTFALFICSWLGMATTCSADWVAGRDLTLNERPNGPQELVNPNPTVPQWSYGWRTTVAGTALTLLLPPEHFNDGGSFPSYDGWVFGNGGVLSVNAGISPLTFNFGFGPLESLDPKELALHPRSDGALPVARWTAPYSATFTIDAYWDDLDAHGGGGGSGHIVVNGASIHDAFWGDGGGSVTTKIQALNPGDTVDFLLGANGNNLFDTTAFDATIVAVVPEPASIALLVAGAALLMSGRYVSRVKA